MQRALRPEEVKVKIVAFWGEIDFPLISHIIDLRRNCEQCRR